MVNLPRNLSRKLTSYSKSLGAPRLGLPAYSWWSEALHGVASSPGVTFAASGNYSYATSFANPIGLASAFDDEMIYKFATIVSTEARAFSNAGKTGLDFWTPNINPYKDPRWGRGMETPGEDPKRIKGYVKALLAGLEGSKPIRKVIATCKHYAGNDLDRWKGILRYGFNAVISMQDLVEYYLPPFQQCARDSKVGSMMCSYNAINGTPACANTYLLQTILREHWGWNDQNQYITSDCNAVMNFHSDHHYTKVAAESAGKAYAAGTDTICEVTERTDIAGAYNQSLLSEATMDRALRRLYQGLIHAGYFDPASATEYRSISWSDVNTQAAQDLALQSAIDGLVLKKNDGTLPVHFENITSAPIAVIGHWANNGGKLTGTYAGPAPFYMTPYMTAQKLHSTVYYANGPVAQDPSVTDTWTAPALEAASKADVVIYFGGNDLSIEREDRDRVSLAWPKVQLSLIEKICALGKPCIVVQLGDQNDDTPLLQNKNVSALLWAGYPGQAGGLAVAQIVHGISAPAGRLPVTQYPESYADAVPMTDMSLRPSATNPGRTYKWYDKAVLPFGHGLHYTTFSANFTSREAKKYPIADLTKGCAEKHLDLCPFQEIRVSVTNTGKVISDFVVLAFVNGTYGPAPHPFKELVGYQRLRTIKPSDTAYANLKLSLGDISRVDESGNSVLYPGVYNLLLDVPTQDIVSFELVGDPLTLDKWPQPPKDLGAL
jgi:xylan 1,4-beta-xylosidase